MRSQIDALPREDRRRRGGRRFQRRKIGGARRAWKRQQRQQGSLNSFGHERAPSSESASSCVIAQWSNVIRSLFALNSLFFMGSNNFLIFAMRCLMRSAHGISSRASIESVADSSRMFSCQSYTTVIVELIPRFVAWSAGLSDRRGKWRDIGRVHDSAAPSPRVTSQVE